MPSKIQKNSNKGGMEDFLEEFGFDKPLSYSDEGSHY
jgi:hypothetical protein